MSKGAKKSNNKTLIALIVVAALVVLGLGVVLAMQFMTGQPAPSSGSQSNNSVVEPDNNSSNTPGPADSSKNSDSSEASNSTTSVNKVLTCTKTASSESSEASPSTSSVTTITANFKDGKLVDITSEAKATTVTSDSESSAKTVTVADITTANAAEYNLPVKEGIVDFTLEGIRSNYELLDFTCEAL
jgi:cytoskeletal protein RodZ